jgi:hypothetical protein
MNCGADALVRFEQQEGRTPITNKIAAVTSRKITEIHP